MKEDAKVIVFDFDGTLTQNSDSVWEMLRRKRKFGEPEQIFYRKVYEDFRKGFITYAQWCGMTCRCFRHNEITHRDLVEVSRQTELTENVPIVLKFLKDKGFSIHILSGGIKENIEIILGENVKYFDNIQANELLFGKDEIVRGINCTPYDYENKPKYIDRLVRQYNISPLDIIFVGNSENDEWAYLSGCTTICMNPENIDVENDIQWNRVIYSMTDLETVVPKILDAQRCARSKFEFTK